MNNHFIYILLLMIGVYFNDLKAQSNADTTGGANYKIGGDIHLKEISKKGNLYILLITEEFFKTPLHSYKKIVLPIGDKEIKEKQVTFKFADIPPGRYGIRCFLDEDGNEKLNKGMFGPSEPWGMSWQGKKPFGWPKFENIAFDVNKDLMDIIIDVSL
jgi:uncharacterized protein (DUF2141 family)